MSGWLDAAWRAAHPLPPIDQALDKDARGAVLVVGGSERVPGAIRLTGEAALRVGAGKLRFGTVERAAVALGLAVPEAGVVALPVDGRGQIAASGVEALGRSLDRCAALVLGPAMARSEGMEALVAAILDRTPDECPVLLDAACLAVAPALRDRIGARRGRLVMTPHPGEAAVLLDEDRATVSADLVASAVEAARRYRAVVVLKSDLVVIAAPDVPPLCHRSGCPGLGTAGSGDVLAGIIGGLMARGLAPDRAAGWGVWLHGEAGQAAAKAHGPLGFLARDLLAPLGLLIGRETFAGTN